MAGFEKEAHPKTSSQLLDTVLNVTNEEFLRLVRDATQTQSSRSGSIGKLEITGRLVNVSPVGEAIVVGDIHGDPQSLKHILEHSGFLEKAEKNEDVIAVFLGDYGDRGSHSPEVYYIILKLKELFPDKVVLMRGNHEGPGDLLAYPHDLPNHLHRKFGEASSGIYREMRRFFDCLYNGVLIEGRCIMLHGGVPSQASTIEDLAYAHTKHPNESHLEEILWSDPSEGITGTHPSPRGAGRLFGEDVTDRLLEVVNARVLIRGHESSDEGFKINHNGKVLTLFSRKGPPYHNRYGAYLQLNLSEEIENARQLAQYIHKF